MIRGGMKGRGRIPFRHRERRFQAAGATQAGIIDLFSY